MGGLDPRPIARCALPMPGAPKQDHILGLWDEVLVAKWAMRASQQGRWSGLKSSKVLTWGSVRCGSASSCRQIPGQRPDILAASSRACRLLAARRTEYDLLRVLHQQLRDRHGELWRCRRTARRAIRASHARRRSAGCVSHRKSAPALLGCDLGPPGWTGCAHRPGADGAPRPRRSLGWSGWVAWAPPPKTHRLRRCLPN